ncbi:MAG: sulfate ABC transporter substrate-binding protein [Azospirillaceae bacterium]|nr:sulfate ABC transporter substrate-binding protein [Azospirillaceae bacterium]
MRLRSNFLNIGAVVAVVAGLSLVAIKNVPGHTNGRLINVSYDPTRELYQALNPAFVAYYERQTGHHVTIEQSHGGSSRQARKVISGEQPADVVTLGLYSDIDALRKRGLIAQNWADRLPNHSLPYTSTIVFVVRQGNPHGIKDWPDLLSPGIEVVTPDPRTSGNGKLAALAGWAAMTTRGGTEDDARAYLRSLYHHVPVLDEGARGSAITFAIQEVGDVHLTWENEALREAAEAKGRLQIVYPPVSILAEPYVAWVDSAVANDGKLAEARAYLTFLFGDAAQEIIARLGYRPWKAAIAAAAGVTFPDLQLVPVTAIAKDWDDANEKFFGENGVINTIVGDRHP